VRDFTHHQDEATGQYYRVNPYDVLIQPSLHPDCNPMRAGEIFVVGGRFDGASLPENGSRTTSAPDSSAPRPSTGFSRPERAGSVADKILSKS
jgi:hypothetical protein